MQKVSNVSFVSYQPTNLFWDVLFFLLFSLRSQIKVSCLVWLWYLAACRRACAPPVVASCRFGVIVKWRPSGAPAALPMAAIYGGRLLGGLPAHQRPAHGRCSYGALRIWPAVQLPTVTSSVLVCGLPISPTWICCWALYLTGLALFMSVP